MIGSCALTAQLEALQRDAAGKFQGLQDGSRYTLSIKEDPKTAEASAAAAKAAAERMRAQREEDSKAAGGGKSKVDDITQQLKALKPEDRYASPGPSVRLSI